MFERRKKQEQRLRGMTVETVKTPADDLCDVCLKTRYPGALPEDEHAPLAEGWGTVIHPFPSMVPPKDETAVSLCCPTCLDGVYSALGYFDDGDEPDELDDDDDDEDDLDSFEKRLYALLPDDAAHAKECGSCFLCDPRKPVDKPTAVLFALECLAAATGLSRAGVVVDRDGLIASLWALLERAGFTAQEARHLIKDLKPQPDAN